MPERDCTVMAKNALFPFIHFLFLLPSPNINIYFRPCYTHISPLCVPRCFISCFSFEILHVRSFIKQCGTKNSGSAGGPTETSWKWELGKKNKREPSERFFSGDEFMHLKIRKAEIDARHRRESHHHCDRDTRGVNVRPFLSMETSILPFRLPVW